MAFNSKNLHYEKQEPAFLRKLRSEHGSDRNNVQFARPQKARLKTADEDDGPTIVDEEGGNVSREEYEALLQGKGRDGQEVIIPVGVDQLPVVGIEDEDVRAAGREKEGQLEKQKVAEIGAPRKRKAVKVVSEDVEDIDVVSTKRDGNNGDEVSNEKLPVVGEKPTKKKSSKKKVKLSFDDEAEE